MDIHGAGRLRAIDGRAGTGYDDGQAGAVGAVASGTGGLEGSRSVGGYVYFFSWQSRSPFS